MTSMALLFFLVLTGSLLTSLTGLGGGTLILAGLLFFYPPAIAIPLHSFTQFTANAMRTGLYFKEINWKVVGAYGLLMLPAAWAGAKIFDLLNPSVLKIVVGLFILFSILPLKIHPKGEPRLRTFVFIGGISGFVSIFVGAIGPAVVPFFNRLKLSRNGNLSTKSAGQMLMQLSKIIAFSGAAGVDFTALKENILILVTGSIIGVGLSIPIGKKITDDKFNFIVNILLAITSIKVLIEGVSELLTGKVL